MSSNIVFILCLIVCTGGCFFCPYWIKTADTLRDGTKGILCLIVCIFMLIVSSWCLIYNNNLLWYGQHKDNSKIEMHLNAKEVENTSFVYLLENFDAETTIDDVIAIMGNDYKESDMLGYEMTYRNTHFTLNGSQSTFLRFSFNRRKTKILSITWAYTSPSQEMFPQTLKYLEDNAFGKPNTVSMNTADWSGLHLEETDYFLLFSREF